MILIAGAGAIGQFLASRLPDATLLVRQPMADALQHGATITGLSNNTWTPKLMTKPEGEYETIILTSKAHATLPLAQAVAPHLAPDGILCNLQNGLQNDAKMASVVAPNQIALGITSHGIHMPTPGTLIHAGRGPTKVGPHPQGSGDAPRRFEALLQQAKLDPIYCENMTGEIWLKAAVNHGLNTIAGTHDVANGSLLHEPLRSQAIALVQEVVSLSRAAGVGLPSDPAQALIATLEKTQDNFCSMVQDLRAKKPTEIEQIGGNFTRLSRRLGYPMFASEDAVRALKAIEANYLDEAFMLQRVKDEVAWMTS